MMSFNILLLSYKKPLAYTYTYMALPACDKWCTQAESFQCWNWLTSRIVFNVNSMHHRSNRGCMLESQKICENETYSEDKCKGFKIGGFGECKWFRAECYSIPQWSDRRNFKGYTFHGKRSVWNSLFPKRKFCSESVSTRKALWYNPLVSFFSAILCRWKKRNTMW